MRGFFAGGLDQRFPGRLHRFRLPLAGPMDQLVFWPPPAGSHGRTLISCWAGKHLFRKSLSSGHGRPTELTGCEPVPPFSRATWEMCIARLGYRAGPGKLKTRLFGSRCLRGGKRFGPGFC